VAVFFGEGGGQRVGGAQPWRGAGPGEQFEAPAVRGFQDDAGEAGTIDVTAEYKGALGREYLSRGTADSGSRPTDEGDFPGQSTPDSSCPLFRPAEVRWWQRREDV
jgi:hypothetical protein